MGNEKPYLDYKTIRDMENMSEEDMAKMPIHQLVSFFKKLLISFRMASDVARAAWGFWQSISQPGTVLKPEDTEPVLQNALAKYAPENFSPTQQAMEMQLSDLQEYYDFVCNNEIEAVRDYFYEKGTELLAKVEKTKNQK